MQKEYSIFLFDADGTLFDYEKAEETALRKMLLSYNFTYNESIRQEYKYINFQLWKSFENGEVSKKVLQTLRFSRLFEKINIQCNAEEFNLKYLIELGNGAYLINGACEICKYLFDKKKKLYIITNGISITQKLRFANSEIRDYFVKLFISEEIGFQKPDIQYFDYVLLNLGEYKKDEILIVGDSLSADIKGGDSIEIDTCWFNANGIKNTSGMIPTYEIKSLKELEGFA